MSGANTYFSNFPLITYNGTQSVDLTRNVRISSNYINVPTSYYTYTVRDGERPDVLSFFAYENPTYDWLILLTNKIIDPYYEWPLSENSFNDYIYSKYGDIDIANDTTIFFRNDWANDIDEISEDDFNNLSFSFRKYYKPLFNSEHFDSITYVRRREDWTVNTNRLQIWLISNSNLLSFIDNEKIYFKLSTDDAIKGEAYVQFSNSSAICFQHIDSATIDQFNTYYIQGANSFANTNLSTLVQDVINIPIDESGFWKRINAYEYEQEKNELNRNVSLILQEFVIPLEDELQYLLRLN